MNTITSSKINTNTSYLRKKKAMIDIFKSHKQDCIHLARITRKILKRETLSIEMIELKEEIEARIDMVKHILETVSENSKIILEKDFIKTDSSYWHVFRWSEASYYKYKCEAIDEFIELWFC